MQRARWVSWPALLFAFATLSCSRSTPSEELQGDVRDPEGRPVPGVFVTARRAGGSFSHSTVTDANGRYTLTRPQGDSVAVFVIHHGDTLASDLRAGATRPRLETTKSLEAVERHSSSWWLGALPDGEEKRKFILDCTGCHQFNETRVSYQGAPRAKERWAEDTRRMLGYAGARSGFPVIAADRDPERTGEWLAASLSAPRSGEDAGGRARADSSSGRVEITEYDLPDPGDLPHDVAVDDSGRVLITGMFTHVIYRLDPATGVTSAIEIPVPNANPRAIEMSSEGDWWVLLGGPKRIARYKPASGAWDSWEIGMYPHSIALSPDGGSVWFNGHFTRDPEEMGRLDTERGKVERFKLPRHPALANQGGPVPYEQRLGPDGAVWMSELQGNRILRLDPKTKKTQVYELPLSWSGPRRFDIDKNGDLWIPGYATGSIWKMEAQTGTFREFLLPTKDALPYVARVSPRDGRVWVGTGAADRVFVFDPRSERFTAYPLPTRGATVRHLVIDPSRGDVWLAYGASPAIHPARVARLRM